MECICGLNVKVCWRSVSESAALLPNSHMLPKLQMQGILFQMSQVNAGQDQRRGGTCIYNGLQLFAA